MNNIKLTVKLLGAFVFVALIAGVVGMVGYFALINTSDTYNHIVEVRMPGIKELGTLNRMQTAAVTIERGLFIDALISDPEQRQGQYAYLDVIWESIEASWTVYEALEKTEEEERFVQASSRCGISGKDHEEQYDSSGARPPARRRQGFRDPEVERLDSEAFTFNLAQHVTRSAAATALDETDHREL